MNVIKCRSIKYGMDFNINISNRLQKSVLVQVNQLYEKNEQNFNLDEKSCKTTIKKNW